MGDCRSMQGFHRHTRIAARDIEKTERLLHLLQQKSVELPIRTAMKQVVIVHHFSVDLPLLHKQFLIIRAHVRWNCSTDVAHLRPKWWRDADCLDFSLFVHAYPGKKTSVDIGTYE
jgi:hypothetical protein